jgi:phospholipid-translocating ATPase
MIHRAKLMLQGRALSYKTFFTWLTISVYQGELKPLYRPAWSLLCSHRSCAGARADFAGGIIMLLSLLLFESEFLQVVAISYTSLVINELIMVALEITTWHSYMILSEIATGVVYFGSMIFLPAYFGMSCSLSHPILLLC